MKNSFRSPGKKKMYDTHKIQDGGIMQSFGKSAQQRSMARKKRQTARKSRKQHR